MLYKVRYFQRNEFECPCCGQVHVNCGLVVTLDMARAAAGVPFQVTSGWRCFKHNREVGGAENSRHMVGLAADIALPSQMIFAKFHDIMKIFFARPSYEIKAYVDKKFVHVAVPREDRFNDEWDGFDIYIGRK